MSQIFDINTHALTVPDIDTHIGLMHTLFALEDMYGLKVRNVDGQPHICLDSSISAPGSSVDEMLRSWMEQADKLENGEISEAPLFLNRSGKPIQAKSVGNIISNVRDELGDKCLKRSFHDLRSTFATNLASFMLKKNLPIGFIQYKLMRLLGHSDFSTTQKYINFARSETFDKQMASWVDKLFGEHLSSLHDELVVLQGDTHE